LAALWAACAAWPCAAAPLEAYGRLPNIEAVAISPDGSALGLIFTNGEDRRIGIKSLAEGKLTHLLNAGQIKVRDLQWAGPDHLLITSSTTANIMDVIAPRSEYSLVVGYDIRKQRFQTLLGDANESLNVAMAQPEIRIIDGKAVVFLEGIHFVNNRGQLTLFRIDLDRAKSEIEGRAYQDTNEWVVGPDGQPIAQSTYDRLTGEWALLLHRGGEWRKIKTLQAPLDRPSLMGLGRDGRSVLVAEFDGSRYFIREVNVETAEWGEAIDLEGELSPLWDPAGFKLIGLSGVVGDDLRYTFFAPQDQAIWKAVTKAFPGERVSLVSASADHRKILVLADSPVDGPAYFLVDIDRKRADLIGAQYLGLKAGDISPVRPIQFEAQDGLELSGYLTLPKGRDAKELPLVVFPHGGPAARDLPGFDWWAQAMASRGYAVLQVNYRGSDGFGRGFLQAGFGQWGRRMQTDLSDGVRYLAAQGVIDPKRVCIVGASYGGYAALAGATLDRGVYRCAASVAGPADMRRFVEWSRHQHGVPAQRWWNRFMGADDSKDPVLAEISPALHADKVEIPVLLIHGKDDTVVPLEQSKIMAQALAKAGKPVEFIVQNGADHWLSRGDTRLSMLQAVVAFLEKNNPPT